MSTNTEIKVMKEIPQWQERYTGMQKENYISMNTNEELRAHVLAIQTCGICSRVCSDPRTLPCFHSFCLQCLKETLHNNQENGIFFCPSCDFIVRPVSGFSVDISCLESLGVNAVFSENRTAILEEHGMVQCKKHPDYICDFFYSDTLDLACDMCKRHRNECCENLTKEAAYIIWNKRQEFLKQSYCSTRSELSDVLNILKSRENEMLAKNDETILGIMKYFMDFKMQIHQYLEQLEKDVLEKLKSYTTTEISKIVTNSQKCFSLLQSIDSHFSFLLKPCINSRDTDALSNYVHVDILQSVADNFQETVKSEKHQAENQTEIRFIINTEIEDVLTGGDLVNVELITSFNTQSGALSNDVRQNIDSFINGFADESNIVSNLPSNSENSVTISLSDTVFPDEPPPPYPGVTTNVISTDYHNSNPLEHSYRAEENYFNQTPEAIGEIRVLLSVQSLPDCSTTPHVPRALTHGVHQEAVTPLATPSDSNKIRIQPIIKFKVDYPNSTERMTPTLVNVCWITEDALLVVDKRNKIVSVYSDQGTCLLVNILPESCEPYGCVAYRFLGPSTKNFLALTIPKRHKIMVYYIHTQAYPWKIKFKNNKKTNKGYTQIAFVESEMKFVCASTSPFSLPIVDVLDEQFNILYTLNGSDSVRLGYPRSVQVSKDGVIAVSDYKTSRVLFMTMRGIHQNVFNGADGINLTDPQGIGYSETLDLFVIADTRANRIYFVTSQGDLYESFGQDYLSENTPRFIDFSTGSTKKVAIGHGNGFVSIYEVIYLTACPLESTV